MGDIILFMEVSLFMLKELRDEVYEANMDLPKHGLVIFTWGNASGLD